LEHQNSILNNYIHGVIHGYYNKDEELIVTYLVIINRNNIKKLSSNINFYDIFIENVEGTRKIQNITLSGENKKIEYKIETKAKKERNNIEYSHKLVEKAQISELTAIIIHTGIKRLRNRIENTNIAFSFLEDEFKISELQQIYEIILDKNIKKLRLDPVERGLCQVVSMECSLGNAYMPHKILIDKKKIIMDADPQIIWNVPDETKSVSLHAIIYVNEDELLNQTIRYCRLIEKRKDIFERDHKRNASHIDELEQKNLEYGNRILSLEKQKIQQENHVSVLEQQKTQQENNISVLKKQLVQQENSISVLKKQLVQQENDIAVLQQQKKNFTEKIFSKEKELYAITH